MIAVPATGDTTYSNQNVLDLSFGRVFDAGPVSFKIDLQFYNIFNNTGHDSWQTLIVAGSIQSDGSDSQPRPIGVYPDLRPVSWLRRRTSQ